MLLCLLYFFFDFVVRSTLKKPSLGPLIQCIEKVLLTPCLSFVLRIFLSARLLFPFVFSTFKYVFGLPGYGMVGGLSVV